MLTRLDPISSAMPWMGGPHLSMQETARQLAALRPLPLPRGAKKVDTPPEEKPRPKRDQLAAWVEEQKRIIARNKRRF